MEKKQTKTIAIKPVNNGRLEMIIGCMYAGKSTEMIRRYHRFKTLKHNILIVNHKNDSRYGSGIICSHDQNKIKCHSLDNLNEIFSMDEYIDSTIIMIEEAQFFEDLLKSVQQAVDKDKKIVVLSGLSADCFKKPFGQVLECIPHADDVMFLSALCEECGDGTPVHFSKRVIQLDDSIKTLQEGLLKHNLTIPSSHPEYQEQVLVGAKEVYRAVCRKHFSIENSIYKSSLHKNIKTISLEKTPFNQLFPFGF